MKTKFSLALILVALGACTSLPVANECDLFLRKPDYGKSARISLRYSSSPMHGAVLIASGCPVGGRQAFGEDTATGPAAAAFLNEIHSDVHAWINDYQMDVTVRLVHDESGPMLEIIRVWSFNKI